MKKLLLIISIAIVGCGGNKDMSSYAGVYAWENNGGTKKEKLDLRGDGTYDWTDDYFPNGVNGVRDAEWSGTWRGKWGLKGGNLEVTFSDYENDPSYSAEINNKSRQASEGVYRFKIEGNGDLIQTHKDDVANASEDTLRYTKK